MGGLVFHWGRGVYRAEALRPQRWGFFFFVTPWLSGINGRFGVSLGEGSVSRRDAEIAEWGFFLFRYAVA